MDKKQSSQKAKNFLRKNVYYIIMAVCLLAIAAMVTVTVLINNGVIGKPGENINPDNPVVKPDDSINKPNDSTNKPDDSTGKPSDQTGNPNDSKINQGEENNQPTAIVFADPVQNAKVINDYSMEMLVWNSTLEHYAVHNGIDFGGADGDNVCAAYDGVVTDVSYDALNGNTVTIKHNDKLTTIYSSLNEPTVTKGQTVKKGGVIGTMGTTATAEYSLGAHVHFSAMENGKIIDPDTYLVGTENK